MAEYQGSVKKAVLWVPVSAILIVGIVAGTSVISNWFACDDAERSTFAEFPQYSGWEVEPWGSAEHNACMVSYDVPESALEIQQYFADQFSARGWTIVAEEPPDPDAMLLAGRRGNYVYRVLLSSLNSDDRTDWTHVEVRVRQES